MFYFTSMRSGARALALAIPLLASSVSVGTGQNLVPNGNFETTFGCPTGKWLGVLNPPIETFIPEWQSGTTLGTPDYYHRCVAFPCDARVPDNVVGFEEDEAGHHGYAGLFYQANGGQREYLMVELKSAGLPTTLVQGTTYRVSFNISSAENANLVAKGFGVYFGSNGPTKYMGPIYGQTPPNPPTLSPQWTYTGFLTWETWRTLSFEYTAAGGENFLVLGFFDNPFVTQLKFPVPTPTCVDNNFDHDLAYYYVDDVIVEEAETCYECPAPGVIVPSLDPVEGDECCFNLIVTNNGSCGRFTDGIQMQLNTSFTTANGAWSASPIGQGGVRWEIPGAPDILPPGVTTLGQVCIDPTSPPAMMNLRLFRSYSPNGESFWCFPDYELEMDCSQNCCDAFEDITATPVDNGGVATMWCEWDLTIDDSLSHDCDIYGLRLREYGSAESIRSNPTATPGTTPIDFSSPVTIGRVRVDEIAYPFTDGTFTLEFLAADGSVICTKTITLRCGAPIIDD